MALLAYKIPDLLNTEIDELEGYIKSFKDGLISEIDMRARRVPFGIYEQRKKGTYMVRIRCTAGIITPSQLQRVAELSIRYASGNLHVTTRQELQIHDVTLDALVPVIRSLRDVGLSTRGGGGNTVRNIIAPWDAGVNRDEPFDVTPYAVALTSELVALPDSWLLPRKYKIAFSSSEHEFNYARINDLGFEAVLKGSEHGFRVYVAGGMGRQSQPGHLLHEFISAEDVYVVAEAIKRVFSKFGNRKERHAARLRFLWNSLGEKKFLELYTKEKEDVQHNNYIKLKIEEAVRCDTLSQISPKIVNSSLYNRWKERYVREQKQIDLNTVHIPLLLGNIKAEKIKLLAEFLKTFGEDTIRFTLDQNIALRNINTSHLGNCYSVIREISNLTDDAVIFGNAVACTGASTCQLGICNSRAALIAVNDQLKKSCIDLDAVSDVRINISGCANSCGQHLVASLGFSGKTGIKDKKGYPVYSIFAGGKSDSDGIFLAEKFGEISAKDLPVFVSELLKDYADSKLSHPSFLSYLHGNGIKHIHEIIDKYKNIPSFDEDSSYYQDRDEVDELSSLGKGRGE